jgi:hypothetical protein
MGESERLMVTRENNKSDIKKSLTVCPSTSK